MNRRPMLRLPVVAGCLLVLTIAQLSINGLHNSAFVAAEDLRDTHSDPWYPGLTTPALITPQWIGEEGVDAVVVLAIDDMRDPVRYEQYLRPILTRLKQIDGRAPVSIMTNQVKPDDPQLQSWLAEGLSIECHSADHPCPILQGGDFEKAALTYFRCVDQLASVPGNRPVAFRTPCCDSLNTVSPRLYQEIFRRPSPAGNRLQIDSSVFNYFTSEDPDLPRDLIFNADGTERFLRYLPRNNKFGGHVHDHFINTIRNYPWPYLIGDSCWQFPCVAPSDWSAQHLQGVNNPRTVDDWKAALDLTVIKKGTFNLVFHPHGWISAEQVVELIDHAVKTHGSRVKFLTFQEAAHRLSENLLKGNPLIPQGYVESPYRIIDVNRDGFMDVVSLRTDQPWTRIWDPSTSRWNELSFPSDVFPVNPRQPAFDVIFGALNQRSTVFGRVPRPESQNPEATRGANTDPGTDPDTAQETEKPGNARFTLSAAVWNENGWQAHKVPTSAVLRSRLPGSIDSAANPAPGAEDARTPYLRNLILRDLNGDRIDELIAEYSTEQGQTGFLMATHDMKSRMLILEDSGITFPTAGSGETNLQVRAASDTVPYVFSDLNHDGHVDVICSDARTGSSTIWLKATDANRFSKVAEQKLTPDTPPGQNGIPFVTDSLGRDSGFFIRDGHFCVQNEFTSNMPDLITRTPIDPIVKASTRQEQTDNLPPILVGAAVVDITPQTPVRLSGYGDRMKESDGVARNLHARCLVIGGQPVSDDATDNSNTSAAGLLETPLTVLVTVDNCGLAAPVVEAVYRKVFERYAVPRARFALSSTHTHSGPWLTSFAPLILTDVPEDQLTRLKLYEEYLTEQLFSVVSQAIESRRPGYLHYGATAIDFAVNRRSLQNGKWIGFGVDENGPTDHKLPLLAATSTEGNLIALFANYACHATTETGAFNLVSPDWPGIAAQELEKRHAGCVALIAIGCGADANPHPRGTHELAVTHGQNFAAAVDQLISSLHTPAVGQPGSTGLRRIDPRIQCQYAEIDLPLGPLPAREEWEQRATQPGPAGAQARWFLELLESGQEVPDSVPNYPVQTWAFGENLAMVFLGGEVVVDYSIRLNEMFDSTRLWINAYSNDVPCYIASKRLLREGGYEVDSSMIFYRRPTRLAPEAEDLICDTIQKLLPHEFYSEKLQQDFPAPKSPEAALQTFATNRVLKLELVASEPLIHDPVAFDWDVQGRLWVVEMGDYPNGADPEAGKTGGRVQVLEDLDKDGRYDKATTFLSGLNFPNGIALWRDGVIVTSAPDVIFARDDNGDLTADHQQVLLTGFTEGNQQHRVNGLRWGLDGWLYLANGDSGGEISVVSRVVSHPDEGTQPRQDSAASIRGRDLRFDPDSGRIEAISGQTQFGRERDDFGHWFGNNNSNPIWQYVLEDAYLRRNPHAAVISTRAEVSAIPGAAPVFPSSRTLARFNDFQSANRFTSACSTMIYRDHLLGEEFAGNAFTSEPVHNLVSRLVLKLNGVTYSGERAVEEQASEVLASSDNWFRPTMLRTGPDGALYVADMYRQVIEHPEWIPPEYQRKLDLQGGHDRGRIYRLVRNMECCAPETVRTQPQPDSTADLRGWLKTDASEVSNLELVKRIESPNGWWRDTAQRVLLHRNATEIVPQLRAIARKDSPAAIRVQALWTACLLSQDHESNIELLETTLKATDTPLKVASVRLLEPYLRSPEYQIPSAMTDIDSEAEPEFVMQVALSLGESKDPVAGTMLGRILTNHGHDPWIRAAAISSLSPSNIEATLKTVSDATSAEAGALVMEFLIPQAAAMGQESTVTSSVVKMLDHITANEASRDVVLWERLTDTLRAVRRYGTVDSALRTDQKFSTVQEKSRRTALAICSSPENPPELRAAAVRFISAQGSLPEDAMPIILSLLTIDTPIEVQLASMEMVLKSEDPSAVEVVFERWRSLSPGVRDRAIAEILTRESLTEDLLTRIERGQILPTDVDSIRRDQLLSHRRESIRLNAEKVFGKTTASARAGIVAQLKPQVADAVADGVRGRAVFEKRCAACHRLGDLGKQIGADLAALRERSLDAILTAIIDPNRAVESKFLNYTAVTRDGLTLNGMLLSETGNSLVLAGVDGKENVVLRTDLEELIASGKSLMPEGLEKDLSVQDLADVILFVQSSGSRSKVFEGNEPVRVRAGEDGIVELHASQAEIYGPTLVFESPHQNLGWWTSTEDYAVWQFESTVTGHYTVQVEYACDDSTAGGQLKFSTGHRLLSARVPGTGTWENYSLWNAGELDVHAGRNQLIVTAMDIPGSALIDIRTIRLIPPADR